MTIGKISSTHVLNTSFFLSFTTFIRDLIKLLPSQLLVFIDSTMNAHESVQGGQDMKQNEDDDDDFKDSISQSYEEENTKKESFTSVNYKVSTEKYEKVSFNYLKNNCGPQHCICLHLLTRLINWER